MPTTDRTTIAAVVDALLGTLRSSLVAEPPTATQPFRHVGSGAAGVEEHPRPFLSVSIVRTRPAGTIDGDRIFELSLGLRLVLDVQDVDAHAVILAAIGAVEDHFDALIDSGVIEGAGGFDDRTWNIEYPKTTAGARVAVAVATETVHVFVQRGQNRVPA